jgi:hypothetical protein
MIQSMHPNVQKDLQLWRHGCALLAFRGYYVDDFASIDPQSCTNGNNG